jgi:hypothetical protein
VRFGKALTRALKILVVAMKVVGYGRLERRDHDDRNSTYDHRENDQNNQQLDKREPLLVFTAAFAAEPTRVNESRCSAAATSPLGCLGKHIHLLEP